MSASGKPMARRHGLADGHRLRAGQQQYQARPRLIFYDRDIVVRIDNYREIADRGGCLSENI